VQIQKQRWNTRFRKIDFLKKQIPDDAPEKEEEWAQMIAQMQDS
jgi:hypothetical protein